MGNPLHLIGETIGHYDIVEPLGRGGMADVYLARDTKHGRTVAIKVLREEATVSVGVQRFLEEIQITARLQHPHVLQLYDSGEIDGRPYYVMPLVEGESLRQRLQRGPLPVAEALEIARQVGSALQYAHDHGVVHRDIKPENVMLQENQALVADFGIALALSNEERTRLTEVGISIGTPCYMSPEQAGGEYDVDARTDVYALGVLLYEMLVGAPPFTGDSVHSVLTKVLSETPPPARQHRPAVPARVSDALERALAKEPADRPGSVAALIEQLQPEPVPVRPRRLSAGARAMVGAAVVVAVMVGAVAALRWRAELRQRDWARVEAIPSIQRLLNDGEVVEAFHLATLAQEVLPDDPTIAGLLTATSALTDITSDPAGAQVSYRPYGDDSWLPLGTTPLENVRLPMRELVVRFEHPDSAPHSQGFLPIEGRPLNIRLPAQGDDQVWVSAGTYDLGSEPIGLDAFRIDRTEVSNEAYQPFVDAGGYGEASTWASLTATASVALDPDRASAAFRDATGRPGPAGWELSRYPEGRGRHPVHGVSWFEAVAYCAWAGKSLPTFYHWKHAANLDVRDAIIAASNLATRSSGAGPQPVGSTESYGVHGAVDLAGNVREWVWNASRDGRYALGGAWDSPPYLFTNYEAIDPWDRGLTNGFRCARYEEPLPDEILAPIAEPYFDFNELETVDNETFASYTRFYAYDPLPLDARATVVEISDDWIRERVEITAAYPEERVPLHVFLPTNTEPPYQTVVYFPGVTAFFLSSSDNIAEQAQLMFLLRSGRALVYPVLKHTYERRASPDVPQTPTFRRQSTVWQTQDIMRAVDYIVDRPELDANRIAYMGLSYGAELAVPVALEKRFSALVLIGAALDAAWIGRQPEEAAPWNFAPRITTPTILINGDADAMHPYAEGQVPFFEAIDVADADKRFVLSRGGHLPPWNEVIRHTLDWLDERLGPVSLSGR